MAILTDKGIMHAKEHNGKEQHSAAEKNEITVHETELYCNQECLL